LSVRPSNLKNRNPDNIRVKITTNRDPKQLMPTLIDTLRGEGFEVGMNKDGEAYKGDKKTALLEVDIVG
jgi:hypothetical protein